MEPILPTLTDGVSATHSAAHGRSASSWGAILAGALVATAVSVILLTLGAGLGFAEVSPWQGEGVSATTFTVTSAIWLIVTQWLSAGVGGYIAGRLRTRWLGTHEHEVFFRDTAHGLVTWALSTLVVVSVVAGSVASLVNGGVQAATHVAASGAQGLTTEASAASSTYGMDKLFRSTTDSRSSTADYRTETAHIVANALTTGDVPAADRTYLAGIVAQKTGISSDDAQKRVDEFIAGVKEADVKAKEAADAARKAASQAALYTALSLLVGAFIASVAAVLGGRLRDQHV